MATFQTLNKKNYIIAYYIKKCFRSLRRGYLPLYVHADSGKPNFIKIVGENSGHRSPFSDTQIVYIYIVIMTTLTQPHIQMHEW